MSTSPERADGDRRGRRAAQRRQEHPVQPHHRRAGGHRRGPKPGVTRDRKEVEAEWLGVPFRVVDTGGWMPGGSDLDDKVSRQVEQAVARPTSCCSSSTPAVGVTEEDEAVAEWLRRAATRAVLVVANKADNDRARTELWEFLSLGLGDPCR
jgi:GTPase